ncbi:MAG: hypothetical protein C0402_10845 [Thermodesulfovibrio sp.]|nr:hypothetical protein [Thermodesulfovibrio sp.]
MNVELIDYSEYYFAELAGELVPANRGGKFVQIRDRGSDREYVVLSPAKLSLYHANIVERFCGLRELDGHWNSGKTAYEIVDPSWHIVGGGRWVIDSEKKTLELGSSSQAYGRFDLVGLEERLRTLDTLQGYMVRVERS